MSEPSSSTRPTPPMRWPERPRLALASELPVPGDGPTPANPAVLAMTEARAALLDAVDGVGRAAGVYAAFGDAWLEPRGRRCSMEIDRMHRAGWLLLGGAPGTRRRRYTTTEAGRIARSNHRK